MYHNLGKAGCGKGLAGQLPGFLQIDLDYTSSKWIAACKSAAGKPFCWLWQPHRCASLFSKHLLPLSWMVVSVATPVDLYQAVTPILLQGAH